MDVGRLDKIIIELIKLILKENQCNFIKKSLESL